MFSEEKTVVKEGADPNNPNQNQPPKKGCCESCCDSISECLVLSWQRITRAMGLIVGCFLMCIAFFWFPLKEKTMQSVDFCDKSMHPWKDVAYHEI